MVGWIIVAYLAIGLVNVIAGPVRWHFEDRHYRLFSTADMPQILFFLLLWPVQVALWLIGHTGDFLYWAYHKIS